MIASTVIASAMRRVIMSLVCLGLTDGWADREFDIHRPAFSNTRRPLIISPSLKGWVTFMNIRWKLPGFSSTVLLAGMAMPSFSSRISMMPPSIFISWICTLVARSEVTLTRRSSAPELVTFR